MSADPSSDPSHLHEHDADRRFIDALLQHHFDRDDVASSDRIDAVLGKIDRSAEAPLRPVPGVRWPRILRPLAAAVVLFGFLLVPLFLSNPASAAIERASIAMARPVDLHYRIEIMTPLGREVPGEVWFRGAELVALRLETGAGEIWAGEGQNVAWAVPPLSSLPVKVNHRGTLLEAMKMQEDASMPFLRMTTLLSSLGEDFEVEYGEDNKTIEARRISDAPGDLPTRMRVRVAQDGIVRELEAEWTPIFGPRGVRLTFLDDAEVPAWFYEHGAHHDADRGVVDQR